MNPARSTRLPGAPDVARAADVAALIATIAGSSILVPARSVTPDETLRPLATRALPYADKADIQILEWIAAQGRGKRRRSGWLM
jgi:hypothetical protein